MEQTSWTHVLAIRGPAGIESMNMKRTCPEIQDALFAALAGGPLKMPAEEVELHVKTCHHCRLEAPKTAREWVSINQALMPEPTEEFWKRLDARILGICKR